MIHKLIKKLKELKKKYLLFKELQVGDVVYASMPLSQEELEKIKPGHRQRPYLIVKKTRFKLYAYQYSSVKAKRVKSYQYIYAKKDCYNMPKTSYLYLDRLYVLSIENINHYVTHYNDHQLSEIEKRITLIESIHNKSLLHFIVDTHLEIGDVFIKDDSYYTVYQKDNNSIYAYCTYKENVRYNEYNCIKLNSTKYPLYVQCKQPVSFSINDTYPIIDIANIKEIESIKQQKKKMKKERDEELTITFTYPLGTILSDTYHEYIYLYTYQNRDYGIRKINEIYYESHTCIIPPYSIKLRELENNTLYDIVVSIKDLVKDTHGFFQQMHIN